MNFEIKRFLSVVIIVFFVYTMVFPYIFPDNKTKGKVNADDPEK